MEEHGDKASDDVKSGIENALKDAKEKLDSQDLATLKAAGEALSQASMKLGEHMHQAAGGDAAPAGSDTDANPSAADDNVVDAEFEETN